MIPRAITSISKPPMVKWLDGHLWGPTLGLGSMILYDRHMDNSF